MMWCQAVGKGCQRQAKFRRFKIVTDLIVIFTLSSFSQVELYVEINTKDSNDLHHQFENLCEFCWLALHAVYDTTQT